MIGGDDLLTEKKTPYWGAYYGVLTKTIGFRSGDQLAVTAGWYIHQGDCRVFNKGPFGGVRYTPSFCKELKLMVEYDTHGWNMGAAMRFGSICPSMCLLVNLRVFPLVCGMNVH